jgi:hypothetical protein
MKYWEKKSGLEGVLILEKLMDLYQLYIMQCQVLDGSEQWNEVRDRERENVVFNEAVSYNDYIVSFGVWMKYECGALMEWYS